MIELLAALALAGLLLLGFRLVVDQVARGAATLSRDARREDATRNGEHQLRVILARAEAGADSADWFSGDTSFATFTSRCEVPAGWMERCRVSLAVAQGSEEASLQLGGPGMPMIHALRLPPGTSLRYFSRRAHTPWSRDWGTSIALPESFALVTADGDTLTYPIGAW